MPTVQISEKSAELLRELCEGLQAFPDRPHTEPELVDDAILRVHRGFYGLPPGHPDGPEIPTGPFRKLASDRPAEVLLRQVSPRKFKLAQPFRYDDGERQFEIRENDVSDLASVPKVLTWLIPRYGRHTLAALLHDHLQKKELGVSSQEADTMFRNAMGETSVPLARRWLIWSAVALRTQWQLGGLSKLRAGAYALLYCLAGAVLGPALLVGTVAGWASLGTWAAAALVVLASPLVLCWVWGRHWMLGLLGGYILFAISFPVTVVLMVAAIYLAVEWVVERLAPSERRNPILVKRPGLNAVGVSPAPAVAPRDADDRDPSPAQP
jgi:hypothetical protein